MRQTRTRTSPGLRATRRRTARTLLAGAAALGVALVASACGASASGEYPERAVQVVVPYPAGSGIDTTTRALVEIVNKDGDLGSDLQVVNRDGGGGTVGTNEVLNAKADGYTIGVVPDGPLTLAPQTEEVAYDPESATLINEIISFPIIFVVPEKSPYQDLKDLVAAAKADPGKITLGEGPLNYKVPADAFERESGARLKRVAFDGDGETTTALLGGNLDVGVMQLASALPQLSSGKLRALGVTSEDTVDLIPDVPTFTSQGIDVVWEAYNVVLGPEGLPDDVSSTLQDAISKAVESDEFAAAAKKLGLIVSGAGPDDAEAHLREKTDEAADILETSQ